MKQLETTMAHHPACPMEIYWDVRHEAGAYCACPRFWPRRVCTECWMSPKRHMRACSRHPKNLVASTEALAQVQG